MQWGQVAAGSRCRAGARTSVGRTGGDAAARPCRPGRRQCKRLVLGWSSCGAQARLGEPAGAPGGRLGAGLGPPGPCMPLVANLSPAVLEHASGHAVVALQAGSALPGWRRRRCDWLPAAMQSMGRLSRIQSARADMGRARMRGLRWDGAMTSRSAAALLIGLQIAQDCLEPLGQAAGAQSPTAPSSAPCARLAAFCTAGSSLRIGRSL